MSMHVSWWALNPDGTYDRALPDVVAWTLSPVDGSPGAVDLQYPVDGRGFDTLRDQVTQDRDLQVAIWVSGGDVGSLRAYLNTSDLDDVAESGVATFSGNLLPVRMEEALVFPRDTVVTPPSGSAPTTDLAAFRVYAATAGTVMATLLQEAQLRGTHTDIVAAFTSTVDSLGTPWTKVSTLKFSPGTSHLKVLDTLSAAGLCEWDVIWNGESQELVLWEPGTRGVDHTVTDPPLILRAGRDLTESPRKHSVRDAGTMLLLAGGEGLYQEFTDATATARRGRPIERFNSQGSYTDPGSLAAFGTAKLPTVTAGVMEVGHGVALEPDGPRPLVDYRVGDLVLSDTGAGLESLRIAQLTVAGDQDGLLSAGLSLNDLIAGNLEALSRRVDGIEGGSTVTGTSNTPPAVDDGKAPAAPQGLTASSLAYYDGGTPLAQVTASWAAVLTNADGTAIEDLAGYEVQFRYQPGQSLPTEWVVAGLTSSTTLHWSPLVQGATVEVRVLAYDRYARDSAWSTEYLLTTATDADAPPVASTPAPYSHLGLLVVPWDGKGSAGETMPGDFELCEIHSSTVSGFTPDRPVDGFGNLDLGSSTTYAGELRAAGEWPIDVGAAGYGVTFYVKLVTRDRSGNAAAASAQGSAVLVQVADGDIAAVSIGKLTVGIMNAIMTISGIIRTAAAGARVELDTAGLRCISASGAVLFQFHIPTSLLTIVGKLIAGAGVGLGATVVVDPVIAGIDLYPNATTLRTRMRANTTLRGDGTLAAGFDIETLNASGQSDGFALSSWSSNVWIGHKIASGFSSARLIIQRVGGLIGMYSNGPGNARVQVEGNGIGFIGNDDAGLSVDSVGGSGFIGMFRTGGGSVTVSSSGEVVLSSAPGQDVSSIDPMGTSGAGFSVRAQNEPDTDGYRTYIQGPDLVFVRNSNNQIVSLGGPTGSYKTFVIPHPADPDRWLVHGCTEGPSAGVEYHGVADIDAHGAVVELPPYFEALTRAEDRHVQVSVLVDDQPTDRPAVPGQGPALGPVSPTVPGPLDLGIPGVPAVPEWSTIPLLAASVPRDGRFRITCSADRARVAWRVFAVRGDVDPLDVEPLRADVDAHGDGPYRYLTRRPGAAEGKAA